MISIIIINYKQKHFLEKCVNSIYKNLKSYQYEIIIVNNSPEDDLKELETNNKNLKIIENKNKGFSEANNLGAKNSEGEYLFFLNADTIIESDFLKKFKEEFSNKNFGAVGFKLYNEDGTFQLSSGKENNLFNEIKNKNEEEEFRKRNISFMTNVEKKLKTITEVDWVSGAAMIVKKDIFIKAGGFDENYFLYYEDADLCQRLRVLGMRIYFFPFSKIIHYKGENVNESFVNETYFYSKQSQLYYYKKNNNTLNNIFLRVYLFFKFFVLTLFTFKKINLKILLLVLGVENKNDRQKTN